jgi:hypothetical protein
MPDQKSLLLECQANQRRKVLKAALACVARRINQGPTNSLQAAIKLDLFSSGHGTSHHTVWPVPPQKLRPLLPQW